MVSTALKVMLVCLVIAALTASGTDAAKGKKGTEAKAAKAPKEAKVGCVCPGRVCVLVLRCVAHPPPLYRPPPTSL